MDIKSIKNEIEHLDKDELAELKNHIYALEDSSKKKISAKLGQIVMWKDGWSSYTGQMNYGIVDRDFENVTRITVIQYMPQYKCLCQTAVDSEHVILLDDYVFDLKKIIGGVSNG